MTDSKINFTFLFKRINFLRARIDKLILKKIYKINENTI